MSINPDETVEQDRRDMAQLVAGEDRALDALMERHAGRIFNYLLRRLGSRDDAEDLAQETFARVYRARHRYRPAQPFTAWLYTIAGNLARNRIRWRTRHPETSLDSEAQERRPPDEKVNSVNRNRDDSPVESLERKERAAAVRAAVERLPEALREVVVLCEWEDLSVTEAAGVLRLTPKAVETKLYRARKQLREVLHRWL
jgi:RNA polymerase sigma-70 factor (ECF subfamily)